MSEQPPAHASAAVAGTAPILRYQGVISAVLFQLGWFASVLGGSAVAVAATVLVVGIHLRLHERRWHEFRFILWATLIGLLCDALLLHLGVLQPEPATLLQPLWLLCLWPMFATTFAHTLHWFRQQPLAFNACAGALAAPLSYFGGSHLAGVPLLQPVWLALLLIAFAWAFVFPLLITLYSRNL